MWNKLQHLTRSESVSEYPKGMAPAGSATATALTFLCFLVVGLLLTHSAMNAPFFWDDLHLVRVHTPADLASAWTGTYDTDHMENPGFRPLTMYFEHFRALAFGENVEAHRFFLLVLIAVFLTMVGALARRLFAASSLQIILGGLLGLLHIHSVSHYFWPTDGIFLLTGILVIGAILACLRALTSGRPIWLLVVFLCTVVALLTREDTITIYPLLIWFGGAWVLMMRRQGGAAVLPKLWLAVFAAAMLIAVVGYWTWRAAAVPNAIPLRVDPAALLWAAATTVQNVGDRQMLTNPWRAYSLLISLWQLWLAILGIVALVALKRRAQLILLFWTGAMWIAAIPLLVVARSNLLLLPVAFWGLLVAGVLVEFWRVAKALAWRVFAGGMILFALSAPAYASFVFQQELRPSNLTWMCRNAILLYGVDGNPTIPSARRESVQAQLTSYGISNLADFKAEWPVLERKARASGRFGVNAQDLPFIPRLEFLPQFNIHPRCEPPK